MKQARRDADAPGAQVALEVVMTSSTGHAVKRATGISGVYEMRIHERKSEAEAWDEFAGLDRLDRAELDDDGPGAVAVPDTVRDFPVTPAYRRSA
jgi:hypothetical protein